MGKTAQLERDLYKFFDGVENLSKQKARGVVEGSLKLAEKELAEAEMQKHTEVEEHTALKAKSDSISAKRAKKMRKIASLQKEVAKLDDEKSVVDSSLEQSESKLARIEELVASRTQNLLRVQETPCLSPEEVEELEMLENALNESRKELLQLQLF